MFTLSVIEQDKQTAIYPNFRFKGKCQAPIKSVSFQFMLQGGLGHDNHGSIY
jgi:hypothetical protein